MLFKMLLIPTMFNIQNLIRFWELRGKGKGTWLLDHRIVMNRKMIYKKENLINYAVWWKNSLKAILHLLRK